MNREIKFRAWHKIEKAMFFVGDDYGTATGLDCAHYLNSGQPVVLMQYTGLKDKNGVEIYEGDILEFFHGDGVEHFEVYFDQKYLGFFAINVSDSFADILADFDSGEIQVIGNKFENPELLE